MRGICLLAVVFALASCSSGPTAAPATTTSVDRTPWAHAKPPADCPVTTSTDAVQPPAPIEPTSKPVVWSTDWYGNDALWVRLAPTGVVPVDQGPGFGVKFPWWRSLPGKLSLTGRPLGHTTGTMAPDVNPAYGDLGFQVTDMAFSAPGCWAITGKVEDKTLRVVVWVQKFDR